MKEVIFNTECVSYKDFNPDKALLLVYSGNCLRGTIIKHSGIYKYAEVSNLEQHYYNDTDLFDLYVQLKKDIPDIKIKAL